MKGRIFSILLIACGALGFGGCTNTEEEDPNRVSNIPWNRPERWESQGPLGGMMNTEGGY